MNALSAWLRGAPPQANPHQPALFGLASARTVRGAAFARWFGRSVAVTPTGEPAVFFHGTRSTDFEEFQTGNVYDDDGDLVVAGSRDVLSHLGPHFTTAPRIASAFAEGRAARWDRLRYVADGVARVIPVYLSVAVVRRFPDEATLRRLVVSTGSSAALEDEMQQMIEEGVDGIDPEDEEAVERFMADPDERTEALERLRAASEEAQDCDPYDDACGELGRSAADALLAEGVEAVAHPNEVEGGEAWVVLRRGAVKSVFNAGSWDPHDPSISR